MICTMKVWCLSLITAITMLHFSTFIFFQTLVSAHWRYWFFDVQFSCDIADVQCRCANRPNSISRLFLFWFLEALLSLVRCNQMLLDCWNSTCTCHCCTCFRRMYVEEDGPSTKKLYIHVAREHEGTYTCSGVLEGNLQEKTVRLDLFSECKKSSCLSSVM